MIKYSLAILIFMMFFSQTTDAQISVIVNKSIDKNEVSKNELLTIYQLNKRSWEEGHKITVVDIQTDSKIKSKFYNFIGTSIADVKKIWLRMKLTGEARLPVSVNSEADVIRIVENSPGAIGYISTSLLNDKVKEIARIN